MEDPSMSNLLPSALRSQKDVLFGNMPEIYQFHSRQETHTHTEPTSCHTVVLVSPSLHANPISFHHFPSWILHSGSSSKICRVAWRRQRGWGLASCSGWGNVRRNMGTLCEEMWYNVSKCTFVCEQKEKFQVYERYCQNKPRSELLWRQCSDSPFFQVVTYCVFNMTHSHIDSMKGLVFIGGIVLRYFACKTCLSYFQNRNFQSLLVQYSKICLWWISLSLQECQKKLDHKLGLDSYLLKPVQRLTKYQLLLKVPSISQWRRVLHRRSSHNDMHLWKI